MALMRSFVLLVVMLALGASAAMAVSRVEVRQELERVEDMRILLRASVQQAHDARALATYLQGWGGVNRDTEAEDLFAAAESLYNVVRGVDHGASGLQALLDVQGEEAISAAQFSLLQRARGMVARDVVTFYRRCLALNNSLTAQLTEAAAGKAQWTITSEPLPWADMERERGRREGLRYGWLLTETFFTLPAADQHYQLAKAKRMGVVFVNLAWDPAVNWANIETAPNVYDFSALDEALERLTSHGMTVAPMVSLFTGTPPAWAIERWGADVQCAVSVRAGRDTRLERRGINLLHDQGGAAFARFLAAYAAHLRARWATRIDAIYLEGKQKELDAPADESAVMDAFWRGWSQLDRAWSTPETLRAAEVKDETAIVLAERCRIAWMLETLRRARGAVREGWPEVRVQTPTFSDDFHRLYNGQVGNGRDAFALGALTDNISTATDNPTCFAMANSVSQGRWLWQTGIHSGCGTTGSAASMQPTLYDAIRVVLGGPYASMRAYFPGGWNRYCDWQIGDSGIGSYYFAPRRAQEQSPIILNTALATPEIAVLWSQHTLNRDPGHALWRSMMAMGHLLRRSYFQFDYLPEDGLAARLAAYKILILSDTQSMSLATCDAIREWVREGGVLLAFGAPGRFDELGTQRAGIPLADVFGAELASMRTPAPINPDKLYTGHPEGAFTQPAPLDFQYQSNMTAVLAVTAGKARAWHADAEVQPAIVEHTFGKGKSLWCGMPVGFLYRESAPYEFAYGLSHQRTLSYNHEQKRYEEWMVRELTRLGAAQPSYTILGHMQRAQLRDDGDWYHVTSNGPKYREYNYEDDRPARTITAVTRVRDGVDNLYVGLMHSEGNYFWGRGYFRSTLAGGFVTTSVALPTAGQGTPIAFDSRLRVPIALKVNRQRGEFTTWVPAAQTAMIAVAPAGHVRLFGNATVHGEDPESVAQRVSASIAQKPLAPVEVVDAPAIRAFLTARRGTPVVIGYGSPAFKPAADTLAAWLTSRGKMAVTLSSAGRRTLIRQVYMDGFGYNQLQPEPLVADILIGNTQDNGLMYRYAIDSGDCYWLPLDVNEDFPGADRALVMLSLPIKTKADGKPGGTEADQQLVIGASYPAEALRAVDAVMKLKI